jgi:hypothetical protein
MRVEHPDDPHSTYAHVVDDITPVSLTDRKRSMAACTVPDEDELKPIVAANGDGAADLASTAHLGGIGTSMEGPPLS